MDFVQLHLDQLRHGWISMFKAVERHQLGHIAVHEVLLSYSLDVFSFLRLEWDASSSVPWP